MVGITSMLIAVWSLRDPDSIFPGHTAIAGTRYLEPIISAIESRQVLRIYYHPYYEDKPYFNEVHPYLLKEHGFRWYMVGMNEYRGELRTYALDRIRDLESLTTKEYRDPDFDVSEYFKIFKNSFQ